MATGRRVVIIGGGFAGVSLAKTLAPAAEKKGLRVTLVDGKSYFDLNFATVRALVDTSQAREITVPYQDFSWAGKVSLVTAKLTSVNEAEKKVVLSNGQELSYDVLVIALGLLQASDLLKASVQSAAEREALMQKANAELRACRSVMIVGGGYSGVELAGEIATDLPNIKVTLCHSGARLMHTFPNEAASQYLKSSLENLGVTVLLNEKMDAGDRERLAADPKSGFTTSGGQRIMPDLIYWCTGNKLNSAMLPPKWLNGAGAVQVDEFLQVVGTKDVYALGDINSFPEDKKAMAANAQGEHLGKNLLKGSPAQHKKYKPGKSLAGVAVGRKVGMIAFEKKVMTGWVPTKLKAQTMFVPHMRKQLGTTEKAADPPSGSTACVIC